MEKRTKWLISVAIIIFSIVIDSVVCIAMSNHVRKNNSLYRTALKTTDKDRFNYIVKSQQGHVVTHAKLVGGDAVEFPEMNTKHKYMAVRRTLEEYTCHTIITTDSKGNTQTETYWSWDDTTTNTRYSKKLSIFGKTYKLSKFAINTYFSNISAKSLIKGVHTYHYYLDGDHRYRYEVIPISISGSFIADTSDGTLKPINGNKIEVVHQGYKDYLKQNLDSKRWPTIFAAVVLITVELGFLIVVIDDGE